MPGSPTLTRRRLLASTLPAVLLTVSGCSLLTRRRAEPSEPLPADQVVFSVAAWPGFAPPVYLALASPSLAVYGDGRVLRVDPQRTLGTVPPRYLVARVDPMTVARFAADAEASGLIARHVDYGFPQVTDLGATTVSLHGVHDEQSVNPYAFSEHFDRDLPRRPRDNRRRLRALIEQAYAVAADAATTAYVPERVVVLEQTDRVSTGAVPRWPGPDPASFLHARTSTGGRAAIACGELTGAMADTVYAAAQANPNQRWLVDGRPRTLVVNALPIDVDC